MAVKPGTMGKALPGFDVAVLRPDGTRAAAGEIGEIAVRRGAASMFLGYWRQRRARSALPTVWAVVTVRRWASGSGNLTACCCR